MNLCLIQAREGGTRFPGKIFQDLCGETVLQRVLNVACQIEKIDHVKIALPLPGIEINDVLSRFVAYVDQYEGDVTAIMRLTGDCPLLDPQVCNLVINKFLEGGWDYVSNVYPRRTFPDGLDCEVFSIWALLEADIRATSGPDREHVTPWMQHNLKCGSVELPVDWSHIRLTVDYPRDIEWLRVALNYHRGNS